MKKRFPSRNGAVTLSVIALLSELWRAFIDFQHEYSNILNSTGAVLLSTLLYTALFVGWAWALLRTFRGNRASLVAGFTINLLFLLFVPIGTLVVYCPSPCLTLWPIMELANWLNLLFGILAGIAMALQILQYKAVRKQPLEPDGGSPSA
jgi:hypothetical protein